MNEVVESIKKSRAQINDELWDLAVEKGDSTVYAYIRTWQVDPDAMTYTQMLEKLAIDLVKQKVALLEHLGSIK